MIGCQPSQSAVMSASVKAGKILDIPSGDTLSDGTAGGVEENSVSLLFRRFPEHRVPKSPSPKIPRRSEKTLNKTTQPPNFYPKSNSVYFARAIDTLRCQFHSKSYKLANARALLNKAIKTKSVTPRSEKHKINSKFLKVFLKVIIKGTTSTMYILELFVTLVVNCQIFCVLSDRFFRTSFNNVIR